MRTIAPFILCLLVFSSPAYALRVDVTNRSDAGGAVVVQGDTTFAWGGSGPAEFAMTVDSEVRLNGTVYTYFYRLHDSDSITPVEFFSMAGSWSGSEILSWGLVTSETAGGTLDESSSITFNGAMNVNFADTDTNLMGPDMGGLDPCACEELTFYVQSALAPRISAGVATDTFFASGAAYAPTPEPGTLALVVWAWLAS